MGFICFLLVILSLTGSAFTFDLNHRVGHVCHAVYSKRAPLTDPTTCKFGFYTNECGRKECYQGPGQTCGVNWEASIFSGKCKDGLMCCSGRCFGCINLDCSTHMCEKLMEHEMEMARRNYYVDDQQMKQGLLESDYYTINY